MKWRSYCVQKLAQAFVAWRLSPPHQKIEGDDPKKEQ